MQDKGFDFEASVTVYEVVGHGEYTSDKGFSLGKIFSPGLRNPIDIAVKDVLFIISDEVAAKTCSPCYDEKNKVMAFPDEEKMVWCFREWAIRLDTLPPELRTKPPKPEPEDEPVEWDDEEITLTDGLGC